MSDMTFAYAVMYFATGFAMSGFLGWFCWFLIMKAAKDNRISIMSVAYVFSGVFVGAVAGTIFINFMKTLLS